MPNLYLLFRLRPGVLTAGSDNRVADVVLQVSAVVPNSRRFSLAGDTQVPHSQDTAGQYTEHHQWPSSVEISNLPGGTIPAGFFAVRVNRICSTRHKAQ